MPTLVENGRDSRVALASDRRPEPFVAVSKKTIWTLNIDNYEPQIRELTFPLLKHYAKKIGAEFNVITERKFPDWPVVYEKLQLHELGQQSEWTIYIDADTLVHPDFFDITAHMKKDTVCHNGRDMAGCRWFMDQYFLRDGRWVGSCNWFACASNWCLDLWRPLDDLTLEEALKRIHPTVQERNGIIETEHLIDDYTLSRNIARFGLKYTTVTEMSRAIGAEPGWMFHMYNMPVERKLEEMKKCLKAWGVS